jgi:endonuclease/exonuclease/phosphatase family metal-dependent hydrolase
MKNRLVLVLAGAAVMTAACNKAEVSGQNGLDKKSAGDAVEIVVYGDAGAKTALDGSSVVWSAGDKMQVFWDGNTSGKEFRLLLGEGTGTGTFIGEPPADGADHYFAAYPSTATFNGSTRFDYTLPATVSYTKGTFAPGTNPMLSGTKDSFDGTFSMKNLCGVMRLKLKGSIEVSSLELTFNSYVSGAGYAYRGNNTLTMSGSSDADKKVIMTMGSPLQLSDTDFTEFYFVLPPGDYDGFSIRAVLPNNNSATKAVTSSFTITRSQVTTLEGTMPAPALSSRPELKVWSLNVTCQSNDDNSSWSSANYWSVRKAGIYAFFNTQSPDIIGTQECEYRQRVNILDNTSGYAAYGLGVDYGKESSGNSGGISWLPSYKDYNTDSSNAIFYKTSKFSILDQGTFWLSDTPSSVGSDDGHNCAWIKFRWDENGYIFYFFNTHFTAHYTDAAYAARKAEATILYDQIASINTENLPVIITGDFNATTTELCGEEKGDTRWSNYYWARNQDGKTSKTSYPTSYNNFTTTCSGFSSIYSSGTCTGGNSNIDGIVYRYFYENAKHGLKSGTFGTDFQAYGGVTYISDHWPITATLVFDYQ